MHHTQHLKTFVKQRLVTTIGAAPFSQPEGNPPQFSTHPSHMAEQAVASITARTPTMDMMDEVYMKGCNATMRLYHDMHSDTI
jgi:hypothetical protein